ncbi:MAG: hypothetical protein ACFFB5_12520 [Promethearchaeota archaeon]
MSKNNTTIFKFVNLLSLIAAIAGTAALLIGIDLQVIGGWFLLLGAEIIFWIMLERDIRITRYFGGITSFILVALTTFVIIGDYTILFSRYDILFLVIYLPFRTIYLGIPHERLTFAILFSSVATIFSSILLVFTDDFAFVYYTAAIIFIGGELLYFWKRDEEELYHRVFGMFPTVFVLLLLFLVFAPIENTPDIRLDLFIILIYCPFRIIESSLPKSATKGRTVAFQVFYSFLGLGLLALTITLEALLALGTFEPQIPSYVDKSWSLLEFTFDLLEPTPLWLLGGFLFLTFHSLDIGVLFLGGLVIFIISEIIFFFKLGVDILSKERSITRDSIYFKLHAILWYLGILAAAYGLYIAIFVLGDNEKFLEASNLIKLISILLVVYLLIKLLLNCITTTFWAPTTITLLSQISFIAGTLIPYAFTEPIVVENIQIEPFMLGVTLGVAAVISLLIATYTITERLKSFILYLWAGWAAIELIVSIFGLLEQNNDLIFVAVPLTILTMLMTIISSRERWWATGKGPVSAPSPPPPSTPPPISPPPSGLESPPSATRPPSPPPTTDLRGPPSEASPPSPPSDVSPLDQELSELKKKERSDKLKKMMQEELEKY